MKKLTISFSAENDIFNASKWYEEQKNGLGIGFLRELRRKFDQIQALPEAFPIKYNNHRVALLKTFPFAIYYKINSKEISIKAILHNSRLKPKF